MVGGSQRGEDFMKKVVNSFKGCGEVKENTDRKDSIGLGYVQVFVDNLRHGSIRRRKGEISC